MIKRDIFASRFSQGSLLNINEDGPVSVSACQHAEEESPQRHSSGRGAPARLRASMAYLGALEPALRCPPQLGRRRLRIDLQTRK